MFTLHAQPADVISKAVNILLRKSLQATPHVGTQAISAHGCDFKCKERWQRKILKQLL